MPAPRDPRQGPHHPTTGTPARRPASVRRTTSITSVRPDGLQGPLRQHGLGRDVVTAADGAPTVVAECETQLVVEYTQGMLVRELVGDPGRARTPRRSSARAPAAGSARCSTCRAAPSAGRSPTSCSTTSPAPRWCRAWRCRSPPTRAPSTSSRGAIASTRRRSGSRQADICAGWQSGGTLLANLEDGRPPVLLGPDAPDIRGSRRSVGMGCVRSASRVLDPPHPPSRRVARRDSGGARRRVLPRLVHRRRRAARRSCTSTPSPRPSIPTPW